MSEPKSLGDIESQLWKKNITFESRNKRDYLDVSKEDFSQNKTINIEGKEITPSSIYNAISNLYFYSFQHLQRQPETDQ